MSCCRPRPDYLRLFGITGANQTHPGSAGASFAPGLSSKTRDHRNFIFTLRCNIYPRNPLIKLSKLWRAGHCRVFRLNQSTPLLTGEFPSLGLYTNCIKIARIFAFLALKDCFPLVVYGRMGAGLNRDIIKLYTRRYSCHCFVLTLRLILQRKEFTILLWQYRRQYNPLFLH